MERNNVYQDKAPPPTRTRPHAQRFKGSGQPERACKHSARGYSAYNCLNVHRGRLQGDSEHEDEGGLDEECPLLRSAAMCSHALEHAGSRRLPSRHAQSHQKR